MISELCRDAQCPIPSHTDTREDSLDRMFRLTDWVARYYAPKIMMHDDGRETLPKQADLLRRLHPVRNLNTCRNAVDLSRIIIREMGEVRDGTLSVAIRHLYFMGLMTLEAFEGRALLGAYGIMGIFELALSMGIPIDGEFDQLMKWMLVEKKLEVA